MKPLIRYALYIQIWIIFPALSVQAASMYVTDVLQVTLRTGPSIDNKIIKMIESGQKVEVVEPGQEWSLVRLLDGKEGWVLNRYLISTETNKITLERLKSEHSDLNIRYSTILEENSKFKAENQKLGSELSDTKKTLQRIRNDYESLESSSAEFLTLKSNFEKVSRQLSEQTQKANEFEEQVANLEVSYYVKWFLAGSGVLFIGFVLGFSIKRQRRQSLLL